ncbi:GIY-YIG nuclease family protein [Patescibacteria group bacterium]|nr:GIY-YIG nuclease family protein [Patescibacteria group bacterium]MBU1705680.1 GIY-YIG nuclease family protein [Patescibacteria group bacterium]
MFSVYVLRSTTNNKRYVGFTSKPVNERLADHLSGSNPWTRRNGPFKIIYQELFEDKTTAIRREHFLKSGQGRKWLDENIPG